MTPGDICLYKEFPFPNGGLADKYLIVLNDSNDIDVPVLLCKTTSQRGRKPTTRGCHHEHGSFLISARADWFPLDTWAVFYDGTIPWERHQFSSAVKVKQALKKGTLGQQTFNSLINCISKSGFVDEEDVDLLPTRRNRRRDR